MKITLTFALIYNSLPQLTKFIDRKETIHEMYAKNILLIKKR